MTELVVKKNEHSKTFWVIMLSGFMLMYIIVVDNKSKKKLIVEYLTAFKDFVKERESSDPEK